MTKKEALIISAYTGVLMVDFKSYHSFLEERIGRPIMSHELSEERFMAKIKECVKKDFLAICAEIK